MDVGGLGEGTEYVWGSERINKDILNEKTKD